MPETFDVFLSHNSQDKPAVRQLAVALRDRGLKVWLDEWVLEGGDSFSAALERAIAAVHTAAIIWGPAGVGSWERVELEAVLDESVRRGLRAIPILLPGGPDPTSLPLLVRRLHAVDLRQGLVGGAFDQLVLTIGRARSALEPELAAFRAWALDRIEHIPLIGIGGGDFRLRFEEIYVPLRLAARREALERCERGAAGLERPFEGERDLALSELFGRGRGSGPHAVVLGHPGAGKTTVLRKIEHQCLTEGPESLGLDSGTVPLFVRLRQLSREDLEKNPDVLLSERLSAAAGDSLPAGLGRRLWERGRLLLLFDGLDELGDAGFRAEVCRYLETHLPGAEGRGVLAALSCRFTGWGGRVTLGEERFRQVEVRPLDDSGCRSLVTRWFEELERAHPDLRSEARRGIGELLSALESADYRTQRLKTLLGSPLLLTLLCVIVLRGRQIPRQRWAFYDECLRVLLSHWVHGKAAEAGERHEAPVVDVETALAALRGVAWELHVRGQDMSRPLFILRLAQALKRAGVATSGERVFDWLEQEAGVVGELSSEGYGFRHLGLEEYLAALHVAGSEEKILTELAGRFGAEGWREIPLLLVGLPGRRLFVPFLERVLAGERWVSELDLLRDCLDEAAERDLSPLLAQLAGGSPSRQVAVLRLLSGHTEPELVDVARGLADSPEPQVADLAHRLVRDADANAGRPANRKLFVLWHPDDPRGAKAARSFLAALTGQGLEASSPLEQPGWESAVDRLVAGHGALALVAAPAGLAPWADERLAACAGLFEIGDRPVLVIRAAGEGKMLAWPDGPATVRRIDLRAGMAAAVRAIEQVFQEAEPAEVAAAPGAPAIAVTEGASWVEPLTGIRFLAVPGGRFKMGGDGKYDGKPIHWVRVSPFWLAETPLTNRQYGIFLEKAGYKKEPLYWRDKRYSAPEQPVVGVGWDDAVAFCVWLSETAGREVKLPSEAQWEFSARGLDGRVYPWGSEEPDKTRARFDLSPNDSAVPVGSYPAGRGPFGHLDLAGNVWEWCLDSWDEKAYTKHAKGPEPVDPVVIVESEERRVGKGGAFFYSAGYLRSASRSRFWAGLRDFIIGFRCAAAAPPSRLGA